jgi:hypothetical protein
MNTPSTPAGLGTGSVCVSVKASFGTTMSVGLISKPL